MRRILSIFIAAAFTMAVGLATTAYAGGDVEAGKALFNNKKKGGCKTCHKPNKPREKKLVGPGLKGVMSRHTDAWFKKWVANPQAVWVENDKETAEMKKFLKRESKKKTRMKPKGKLSDADIENLLAYLKTL